MKLAVTTGSGSMYETIRASRADIAAAAAYLKTLAEYPHETNVQVGNLRIALEFSPCVKCAGQGKVWDEAKAETVECQVCHGKCKETP